MILLYISMFEVMVRDTFLFSIVRSDFLKINSMKGRFVTVDMKG